MTKPSRETGPVNVDARRLAACLKACEGIPTEKLEDGILLKLVAACFHVDDPEVRQALEELVPTKPRLVKSSPRGD